MLTCWYCRLVLLCRYPRRVRACACAYVHPGRGHAICTVKYQAIVFMPFQGEVVEGVITTVHMTGLFVQVGPVTVFVMAGYVALQDLRGL